MQVTGIRKLISDGSVEEAQKKFLDFFESLDELKNEIIQQSARLSRVEKGDTQGVEYKANSNIMLNRITLNMIVFCSKVEDLILEYFPNPQRDVSTIPFDEQLEIKLLGMYDKKDHTYKGEFATFFEYEEFNTKRKVIVRALRNSNYNDDLSKNINQERLDHALRIKHRNIVKILNADLKNDPKYLVLEYIDGISLDHLIGYVPFSQSRIIKIIKQLCDALYYLHVNGVAHSNIKPDKVIIDTELYPVISFFDIASSTRSNQPNLITVQNLLYASPEIIKGDIEKSNPKCDQFSLGLLAFELILGKPLFYDSIPESRSSLNIQKIFELRSSFQKDDEYRKQQLMALNVSEDLRKIIERTLHEDPAKRFGDMRELKKALDQIELEEDSVSQIALESYERCCIANPQFTQDFYDLLFKKSPEIKEKFDEFKSKRNPKQQKMLMIAIELLISHKNNKDKVLRILNSNNHKGISNDLYRVFMDVIIECIHKNDYLFEMERDGVKVVEEAWKTIKKESRKIYTKLGSQKERK